MSSSVLDHGAPGAKQVTEEQLLEIEAPPATETWFPISHSSVLSTVSETLYSAGFNVTSKNLLVSHQGKRFFGVLDVDSYLAEGVTLSVGVRNSCDKSVPISACFGSRVFVCSNLAFHSEIVIARRHTKYGNSRFTEAISLGIHEGVTQFVSQEKDRISLLQNAELSGDESDALILRAFEKKIISSRQLPEVIQEWRKPSYPDFEPRTAWSLFNCFTHVIKPRQQRNPQRAASETLQLYRLLTPSPAETSFATSLFLSHRRANEAVRSTATSRGMGR